MALFSKEEPLSVSYGIGTPRFDQEGRIIVAKYKEFTLFNIYIFFPKYSKEYYPKPRADQLIIV